MPKIQKDKLGPFFIKEGLTIRPVKGITEITDLQIKIQRFGVTDRTVYKVNGKELWFSSLADGEEGKKELPITHQDVWLRK